MKEVLLQEVEDSHRWEKWLHEDEKGKSLHALTPERQDWIVATCCRYIWQQPRTLAARGFLYANSMQTFRGLELTRKRLSLAA